MKLLFVADPLESFKTYKDTTFSMMREAARRGHQIWACEPADLVWVRGARVVARGARAITLTGDEHAWFEVVTQAELALADTDAIVMRKDPPFDSEFFYATHLLGQAEREGAKVFNKPAALRDHPEKLAILEFPQFIAPTLVTRSADAIRAFHAEHQDIILKPLDGMGGMGIFRVGPDGLNLGSITETLNQGGAQTVMVQKYLAEIVKGDLVLRPAAKLTAEEVSARYGVHGITAEVLREALRVVAQRDTGAIAAIAIQSPRVTSLAHDAPVVGE